MRIAIVGLSLSSSWGNGHATTYRSLIRGLDSLGHEVHFLERDVPWYADNRDLPRPDFCELHFYGSLAGLHQRLAAIGAIDSLIVGSYVPDGVEIIDRLAEQDLANFSFYDIDTPVTLARLAQGDEEYLAPRQVSLFDNYFSFAGGKALRLLRDGYGAGNPVALYCSVDEAHYAPMRARRRWDLGYLGTYSEDRQPALERLLIAPARRLPHLRFVVAGPQYPPSIDWPANVERVDHLPPSEHRFFYARQRFTLNVTRKDMVELGHAPSVRLFEAAACGTPIISDRWDGLTGFFPEGEAIFIADQSQHVEHVLASTSEAARDAIANRARALVLSGHTGTARARQLVAAIGTGRHAPVTPRAASPEPTRQTSYG